MLKYSTYRSIYNEMSEVHPTRDHSASIYMIKLRESSRVLLALISKLFRQDNIFKFALVLMLIISGFTVVGNVFAGSISTVQQERRVVVERGDTLWSIALENKPVGMKTTVYIEGIKSTSGLENSEIKAGDILSLPVY